jgi:hypothetical protein
MPAIARMYPEGFLLENPLAKSPIWGTLRSRVGYRARYAMARSARIIAMAQSARPEGAITLWAAPEEHRHA